VEKIHGQCHCGGVQVDVPIDTFGVVACHCGDCQKLHGNFFAMLAAPTEAVEWSGDLPPQWYDSSPQAKRAHCPRCGSRLAKVAAPGQRTLLSAGLFSRHLPRRIEKHVWDSSHPRWYDLPPLGNAPHA
jgi:hypothetical protein